jgi:peptide methionine sulfoxide reductase MsrB
MSRHTIQFDNDGVFITKNISKNLFDLMIKLVTNPGFCAYVEELEEERIENYNYKEEELDE